jgi:hypothetical protein
MGFSFYSTGGDKRPKECWNESHVNGSAPAAITKEKPAGVNRPRQRPVIGNAAASDRREENGVLECHGCGAGQLSFPFRQSIGGQRIEYIRDLIQCWKITATSSLPWSPICLTRTWPVSFSPAS